MALCAQPYYSFRRSISLEIFFICCNLPRLSSTYHNNDCILLRLDFLTQFLTCKIGAIAERNINFSFIQSCKFFSSILDKENWKVQMCYIWNTFYHLYIAIIDHDRLIHYIIITQIVLLSLYNTWRVLYIFFYVYIAVFANYNI